MGDGSPCDVTGWRTIKLHLLTRSGALVKHELKNVGYIPDGDANLLNMDLLKKDTGIRHKFLDGGLVFENEGGVEQGHAIRHGRMYFPVVAPKSMTRASGAVGRIEEGLELAKLMIDVEKHTVRRHDEKRQRAM